MLGVSQIAGVRYHDRGNGAQPRADLSRVVESTHLRIAGGDIAIRLWAAWILLDREEQFRHGLIKAPGQKMRGSYHVERPADAGAGTEAQRSFNMLDRDIGLARPFLSMPLRCQPRAKLGLSATARSTSAIITPISSPK